METDREADAESGLLIDCPGSGINFLPFPVHAGTRLLPTDPERRYKLFFYTPEIPAELIHTYSYQQEANWTTYAPDLSVLSWRTGEWISPAEGCIRVAVQSPPEEAAITDLFSIEPITDLFSIEPPYAGDVSVPDWMRREVDRLIERSKSCRSDGDVALLLLTDSHYTVGGVWPDTLKSLRLAADKLHPDALVHLGDFSDGMLPGRLTRVLAERMLIQLKEICEPLWCCLGNHDWNYFRGNPERMTRSACARLYQGRETPWYNVDLADGKLRMLFMDSFDPEERDRYGFSKEQIRGQIDKPVELTYVSEGDTLSAVVRRASMLVKDFNAEDVSAWYGDKQEFNAAELETFASGSETDKQLLAVLSRGTVVASDAEKVSARNLNGVFVKKAEVVAPKVNSNKGVKSNGAVLKGFSRNSIAFTLKTAGTTVVKVSDPNGEVVATVRVDNAPAGFNSVAWNSENIPSGRYMVSIEQSFGISGKFAVLK